MRAAIETCVASIAPWDAREAEDQAFVLDWIRSGAPLMRCRPPSDPEPHLVSYFAVLDGAHILLGDHIKSGLMLPNGGHVDEGEHPRDTVIREVREELFSEAVFLRDDPLFVTKAVTRGPNPHRDISLWYALRGDRTAPLRFDTSEFRAMQWFAFDAVPFAQSDPEIARFLAKVSQMLVEG